MSALKPVVIDGLLQRRVLPGDIVAGSETVTAVSTIGAATLTGAILLSTQILRTGSTAAWTDTTDTATNIIAALTSSMNNGAENGLTWRIRYRNTLAFACTLAAGTNVTLSGNTVIGPFSYADLLVSITNGTPVSVVAATTTNASATVTGMTYAQTALISAGQAVSGTGISASTTVLSVQPGTGVTLSANATATGTLVALTFAPRVTITNLVQAPNLAKNKYTAVTSGTGTASAGDMEGAEDCFLNYSGQAAITITTRTGDQIIAGINNAQIGMNYLLRVINRNSNTLTLSAGSGVTITGTATLPTVTWTDFIVTYTAASTIVLQNAGSALI